MPTLKKLEPHLSTGLDLWAWLSGLAHMGVNSLQLVASPARNADFGSFAQVHDICRPAARVRKREWAKGSFHVLSQIVEPPIYVLYSCLPGSKERLLNLRLGVVISSCMQLGASRRRNSPMPVSLPTSTVNCAIYFDLGNQVLAPQNMEKRTPGTCTSEGVFLLVGETLATTEIGPHVSVVRFEATTQSRGRLTPHNTWTCSPE